MKKLKLICTLCAAFTIGFSMFGIQAIHAVSTSGKINADNYEQNREQMEKEINGDNVIDRTTSKYYTFGTFGRVHIDGWNITILSTEIGADGVHTITFKADSGYTLPTGKSTRFVSAASYSTTGKNVYTINEEVGTFTFKPVDSYSTSYNAKPVLIQLTAIKEQVVESIYLKNYVYIDVAHKAIPFSAYDTTLGISFQINGSRSYLVKKNTDLKVYYVAQEHFKPIETAPSKTGVSFDHQDYRNRYRVIAGARFDTSGETLSYDTTLFKVFVYNYNTGGWVPISLHDFYYQDNTITLPSIDNENVVYPNMQVIGYKVQRLMYEPKMANITSWNTNETYNLNDTIQTKASDYDVQWTSTGVDGGTDQNRYSSLRHRAGDIYLTPLYQSVYTVRFIDYDGSILSSSKVLKGTDATAPEHNPSRENYQFDGWDKTFTNIQGDLDVHALYSEIIPENPDANKVTVTFVDYDGTTLKADKLEKGTDAVAPTNPQRAGYQFSGWDKAYTNVQEDLVVTALYTPNTTPIVPVDPGTPTLPTNPTTAVTVTPALAQNQTVTVDNTTPTPIEEVAKAETPKAKAETVKGNETPLSKGMGSWALINLICAIVTTFLSFILLFAKHQKEEDNDEDEMSANREENVQAYQRRRWTKVFAVLVTIISVIFFILTEDMSLPMQYIDEYTLAMVIILVVQGITFFIARKWKEKEAEEQKVNNTTGA